MALTDIRYALLTVLPGAVYHFEASESAQAPYLVWSEDTQGSARHANNTMLCQAIQGTVDLYTRDEYDPLFDKVQRAFAVHHIPFRLRSIQRERDTGLIHYEWIWEAVL